jgi:amino acid transporter
VLIAFQVFYTFMRPTLSLQFQLLMSILFLVVIWFLVLFILFHAPGKISVDDATILLIFNRRIENVAVHESVSQTHFCHEDQPQCTARSLAADIGTTAKLGCDSWYSMRC